MAVNGSDALLLKTTGGTIVKNQTVNDLGNYLNAGNLGVQICGGRLGLQSGVPISTSDISGASAATIYLNAYLSNWVLLYDGTAWVRRSFSTPSVAPPSVATKAFDIFAYWTGSAVALETVNWTNDTTRATSLTRQDGILVKSGDATRLYLGSARTVASGQTESSAAKRFLWNNYHPVPTTLAKTLNGAADGTAYNSATIRQAGGNTANQVEVMIGTDGGHGAVRVTAIQLLGRGTGVSGPVAGMSVALDSTTTFNQVICYDNGVGNSYCQCTGFFEGYINQGWHYLSANERGINGTITCTWFRSGTERGIYGSLLC